MRDGAFTLAQGPEIGRVDRRDGDGLSEHIHELHLIPPPTFMDVHNGAHVSGGETVFGRTREQDDETVFIDHGSGLSIRVSGDQPPADV